MSSLPVVRRLRAFIPQWVKDAIRNHFSVLAYDRALWAQSNPFYGDPPYNTYETGLPFRLGIIEEISQRHHLYIGACREMKVPYQVIDLTGPDWMESITQSECNGFLVWPTPILSDLKALCEERIKVMTECLGAVTCPTFDEIWLYESKRRMHDWLDAHRVPHPRTWVFYDREQATSFIHSAKFPLVFKTDFGACALGVRILNTPKEARSLVRAAFGKGIKAHRSHPGNRQIGHILLQEYVHVAKEWRMVRIGDSYFGHTKEKVGDFHSGSKKVGWLTPPTTHLDFLKHVTELGEFTSMGIDVFETNAGELLVNELQTVFGASGSVDQMKINGVTGRYFFDNHKKQWRFEAGDFARNACANLRVEALIAKLIGQSDGTSSVHSNHQQAKSRVSAPKSRTANIASK